MNKHHGFEQAKQAIKATTSADARRLGNGKTAQIAADMVSPTGKDPDAVSLKSNPAHVMAAAKTSLATEPASIFANAVELGSPRLSGDGMVAMEHMKTLEHADSSKALLYPASEDFRSGGKLTDGFAEQFNTTNSKTLSMSVHNGELGPMQIAEAARALQMAKKNQSRFNFARSVVHEKNQEEDDEIVVPKPIQDMIARSIRTPSHSLTSKSKTNKSGAQ